MQDEGRSLFSSSSSFISLLILFLCLEDSDKHRLISSSWVEKKEILINSLHNNFVQLNFIEYGLGCSAPVICIFCFFD